MAAIEIDLRSQNFNRYQLIRHLYPPPETSTARKLVQLTGKAEFSTPLPQQVNSARLRHQ